MTKSKIMIAFDADDTLWHNETYYQQAGEKFRRLFEGDQSAGQVGKLLSEIEIRNVSWYGYGIKSYTLSMIEAAIAITGGKVTGEGIQAILDLGREMLSADVHLFEHTSDTLTSLAKDHDLMLITKGDLLEQDNKVQRSGLARFFKYIEIVQDKTPASYKLLLARYHISAGRFVMVGNSLKSDILPVLEIGGRAVYIPYQHTWVHEQVDAPQYVYDEIEHLGQLPAFINSLDGRTS